MEVKLSTSPNPEGGVLPGVNPKCSYDGNCSSFFLPAPIQPTSFPSSLSSYCSQPLGLPTHIKRRTRGFSSTLLCPPECTGSMPWAQVLALHAALFPEAGCSEPWPGCRACSFAATVVRLCCRLCSCHWPLGDGSAGCEQSVCEGAAVASRRGEET